MTTMEELMQAALSAPNDLKARALRVLRGESQMMDAETLRRCSGQAERYLTLREVGRRLGVSACSLWRWGVPGHELGGRRRFRMSEVEAYLASDEFKKRAEDLKVDRRDVREDVKTERSERHAGRRHGLEQGGNAR